MYYPSVDLTQEGIQEAIDLATLKLQTGQWVHDLISKGRIINTTEGVLIVWRSPGDTFKSYNERYNRLAGMFRRYNKLHKPFRKALQPSLSIENIKTEQPGHQQLQAMVLKGKFNGASMKTVKQVMRGYGYAFNHGLHAGSTQESEYQSAQNLFGTILGRGRQHQERTTHSNLIN